MPMRPPKPCSTRGCGALTTGGKRYCQAHSKTSKGERRNANPIQYGGKWRTESRAFLAEPGNAWCSVCQGIAQCVDHIEPHKGDEALFWDTTNWQALCNRCHSVKTTREDGGFGNKMRKNPNSPGRTPGDGGSDLCL